jgi:hypothetical protein
VLSIVLASCTKAPSTPKCSWFPMSSSTSISYSKCDINNNTPPYPCTDINTSNTDSSMFLDNMIFAISDCTGENIFYKSGSISRILLVDGSLSSSSQRISEAIFSGRSYSVTQYKDVTDSYIYSTLTNETDGIDIIKTTFSPNSGFYQIDYISNVSGNITTSYTLK